MSKSCGIDRNGSRHWGATPLSNNSKLVGLVENTLRICRYVERVWVIAVESAAHREAWYNIRWIISLKILRPDESISLVLLRALTVGDVSGAVTTVRIKPTLTNWYSLNTKAEPVFATPAEHTTHKIHKKRETQTRHKYNKCTRLTA